MSHRGCLVIAGNSPATATQVNARHYWNCYVALVLGCFVLLAILLLLS